MRAVWIVGNYPADQRLFDALARRVEVTVYGTQTPQPTLMHVSEPPRICASRTFEPLVASARSGHLRWLYKGLSAALTADAPDVVHVVSEPWGLLAVQAATWARRRPGVTLAVHGCDRIWSHGSGVEQAARRSLARYTLARADGYAAESDKAVELARAGGLRRRVPTAVIHTNPRDPDRFHPPTAAGERDACRQALGLPVPGIGIGFAGRMVAEKGVFLLLDAVRRHLGPSVWCALAGTGPELEAVRDRASAGSVHVLGGLAYPQEMAPFYRALDVFVLPSYTTAAVEEQSPRAVIEAMLTSCVVVGTTCGAMPQMIEGTGVVVEENDAAALEAGLRRAIELVPDVDLRRAARERAIGLYSADAVARQVLDLWWRAAAPDRAAA